MRQQELHEFEEKGTCQEEFRPVKRSKSELCVGGAPTDDVFRTDAPLVCGVKAGDSLGTPDACAEVSLECPEDRVIVVEACAGPKRAVEIRTYDSS